VKNGVWTTAAPPPTRQRPRLFIDDRAKLRQLQAEAALRTPRPLAGRLLPSPPPKRPTPAPPPLRPPPLPVTWSGLDSAIFTRNVNPNVGLVSPFVSASSSHFVWFVGGRVNRRKDHVVEIGLDEIHFSSAASIRKCPRSGCPPEPPADAVVQRHPGFPASPSQTEAAPPKLIGGAHAIGLVAQKWSRREAEP